jgi:hypothetical protein
MLKVKEKIPYCLNEELLSKLMLFPCESSEYQITNKEPLPLYHFLAVIAEEVYKESPAPAEVTVVNDIEDFIIQIGSKYYGFKTYGDTYVIKETEDEVKGYSHCALGLLGELLKLIKVSKNIAGTLAYTWYFFDGKTVAEIPAQYFYFFVCRGDQIMRETCLCEGPGWHIPENVLVDKRDDKRFDRMDEDALTVICYRKWSKEALSGQIYAVRKELEGSENDSIADVSDAGLQELNDKELEATEIDSITDAAPQQLNGIEITGLLKKIRRDITYGILLICILLFFILIRIH